MLRGNLSSRPFYNERLVSVVLGAVLVLALLLTAINAWLLITLSNARGELRTRIDSNRSLTARIKADAERIQKSIDSGVLIGLANATREANELIDRRTFSWTVFFSLIERTLPVDVRLGLVSPRVDKGVLKVGMTVVARSLGDIDSFTDALLATGAFYDVVPVSQELKDDGTYAAAIDASYVPPQSAQPAPAPTAGTAQ